MTVLVESIGSVPRSGDGAGDRQSVAPARYREQMAAKDVRVVEVSGRTVEISSPDKMYFPELGATKSDLVSYYIEIADELDNAVAGRPALLERFPEGAGGSPSSRSESRPALRAGSRPLW